MIKYLINCSRNIDSINITLFLENDSIFGSCQNFHSFFQCKQKKIYPNILIVNQVSITLDLYISIFQWKSSVKKDKMIRGDLLCWDLILEVNWRREKFFRVAIAVTVSLVLLAPERWKKKWIKAIKKTAMNRRD